MRRKQNRAARYSAGHSSGLAASISATAHWRRAVAQALGTLTAFGRRTLSRAIWAQGQQDSDWSAAYRLHARCRWQAADLFQPILKRALSWRGGRYVALAIDDTRLRKTGRRIPSVAYGRDPLSPKFRFNLMLGLRFLQVSLLLPLYRCAKAAPRALPVRFEEAPPLKKPRRKAAPEEWAAYRAAVRQQNLSTRAIPLIRGLRAAVDAAGSAGRTLLMVGDNSFCNRTLFTPEQLRHDHRIAWQDAHLPRRAVADDSLQRGGRRLLAERRQTTSAAPIHRCSHPLPRSRSPQILLPRSGFSADH